MNLQINFSKFLIIILIILSASSIAQISSSGGDIFTQLNQSDDGRNGPGDIIRKIPLPEGCFPMGIEWVHDTLYVLSQAISDTSSAVLLKINPMDGTIYSQISLPFIGYVMGMTFDTKNLWIVKWLPGQEIYHITKEGEIISSFPAPGTGVRGIAWDGQNLWIGEAQNKIFYQVDSIGNIIKTVNWNLMDIWPMGMVWVQDHTNGHLWVNDDTNDQILQLDPDNDFAIVQIIPFPYQVQILPEGICYDGENLWVGNYYSDTLWQMDDGIVSGIQDINSDIPSIFSLSQNYPNPFNPVTTIEFTLPAEGSVLLTVHNILGELVAEILSDYLTAGKHKVSWKPGSEPSGIYFYTITTADFTDTKKMLIMK